MLRLRKPTLTPFIAEKTSMKDRIDSNMETGLHYPLYNDSISKIGMRCPTVNTVWISKVAEIDSNMETRLLAQTGKGTKTSENGNLTNRRYSTATQRIYLKTNLTR